MRKETKAPEMYLIRGTFIAGNFISGLCTLKDQADPSLVQAFLQWIPYQCGILLINFFLTSLGNSSLHSGQFHQLAGFPKDLKLSTQLVLRAIYAN